MQATDVLNLEDSDTFPWFNTILFRDSRVFIDPYLVFSNAPSAFANSYGKLTRFFREAYALGAKSGGDLSTPAGQKLVYMLKFPEPEELCLGYAREGNRGAGTGDKFGMIMCHAILEAIARGLRNLESFDEVGLVHEGIARDRISDITGRILLPELAAYTQLIANNSVSLRDISIPKGEFNFDTLKWETLHTRLPWNPFKSRGLVLVPKAFLRRDPTLNPEDFRDYLITEYAEESPETRATFNWQIVSKMDHRSLIELAKENRFLVQKYLDTRRKNPVPVPYNFASDPDGIYKWAPAAKEYAASNPCKLEASNSAEFISCVRKIVLSFKAFVENGGYKLLWDDKRRKPKSEEASQLLFVGLVKAHCLANNIDLSREVNLGRGPVDFKFSRGYSDRALLEVKRGNNGKFANGLQKQLVKYLEVEDVHHGFYLVIRQSKQEDKRIAEIESDVANVNKERGVAIEVVVVDSSPFKPSASKL